jgi:hypothetical protein
LILLGKFRYHQLTLLIVSLDPEGKALDHQQLQLALIELEGERFPILSAEHQLEAVVGWSKREASDGDGGDHWRTFAIYIRRLIEVESAIGSAISDGGCSSTFVSEPSISFIPPLERSIARSSCAAKSSLTL